MNIRFLLALFFGIAVITGCGGGGSADRAVPTPPATNNNGSVVTGVVTPVWAPLDPAGPDETEIPLPNFQLRADTDDLTLNLPVDDPADFGDPFVAISALDGWSTTEPWSVRFAQEPVGVVRPDARLDPNSVVPGGSVRFFEVTLDLFGLSGLQGAVLAINKEMVPGVDFFATASGANVVILPLKPLKEFTAYMAVLTNGIKDADGNNSTPDQLYDITKRTEPLVDANGNITEELAQDLDPSLALLFEGVRRIHNTHLAAAASVGIDPDDVTLTWTAITQSITPVTKTVRSLTQPAPTTLAPTPFNTGDVGGFGLADISIGVITLPYYAGVPSAQNPTAPLNEFWEAAPGAYVPPFDQAGFNPTSTNLTIANPVPVIKDMQTVPLLVATPNANSGMSKPAAGWPVVIFGHGLTRNRTDALAIADTMAQIGYAVVAMDFPLHGVNPDEAPELAGFYIENTPFALLANERHFGLDIWNNATLTPGQPDGLIDPVGANVILGGIASLLTSRDTVRQGEVDLSVLAVSIPFMDLNGDTLPDFDGSNIGYVGQSWGGMHGAVFAAVEPTVNRAVLSVPPGGLARLTAASPVYAPFVNGILGGLAGVEPGTDAYNGFLFAWQTAFDSADSINWMAEAGQFNAILLHEVIDDTVVPNFLPTAPLSGTEPLIAVGGLAGLSATRSDPAGIRAAVRFLPPATHGSLLDPSGSPAATVEMQGQMASFIATFGTTVVVTDPSVLVPE